ncbi:sad [Drosophila busckii]|uniref:Sad n=1 Tax=Drosophila busckii TaxID=30019 RepID=A0A0M4EJV6_DROBS|nr:cytochrome P450 315a1, mitochondrial [Drosophila busckii]ALC47308.1 sad [Drosophila busckii]
MGRWSLLRWALQLLKTLLLRIMCHFRSELHSSYTAQSLQIVPKYEPIPRIKGLPVLGTLLDIIAAGGAPNLHKYVDARHRQYGAIYRERLGGTKDAVFIASAQLMRSVFQQEGHYPQHPLPDAWVYYNKQHACQRGLFFMEGAEWLHNRRILNRLLLNGNLNWMDAHIERCTQQLLDKWRGQTAQAALLGEHYELPQLEQQLYRWSIEVLCGIMFGVHVLSCERIQDALTEFTQIVHKVFEHSSKLMSLPPRLAQLLRLRIWRDFEHNVDEVLQQGAAIIELCIGAQQTQEQALYQRLLAAAVPAELIRRIFVDLVIAAGDTTAFSSQWALYLLSLDSQLQQRIAQERALGESQLLHGLIKEALRLYPVAPFIGRYMPQDAQIGGHFIEKDTLVLLSLYTAGRDPAHFEQPLRVMPERWYQSDSQQTHQPHASLPFAIGQRSCIGRRVALKQLHLLLGKCAAEFQLQCLNEQPVDSVLRMVTVPDQTLRLALTLQTKSTCHNC